MNEQIKLIGKQLGLNMEDTLPDGTPNSQLLSSTKFAQTIAQECADVLLKCETESTPFNADAAVEVIKKHFGVR